jgi:hypothetical protein
MLLCGIASVAIFVLLWTSSSSRSMPGGQDEAALSYAIVPLTWTMAALAVAAVGLIVGWLLPMQVAAPTAAAALLAALCFVFWNSMLTASEPSVELAALIGGSLLVPLMFGWLLGDSYKVRAGLEPSHES